MAYVDYIEKIYSLSAYSKYVKIEENVNIIDKNVGQHFMEVDIDGDEVEVPCLCRGCVIDCLDNKNNISKVNIPLLELNPYRYIRGGNMDDPVKTAAPLLKLFFIDTKNNILSHRIINDQKYYGGEGLIMLDNYEPLCMFSIILKKKTNGKYYVDKQLLRINPIVYTREDLMSKHIRTKMITEIYNFSNFDTLYICNRVMYSSSFHWDFEVAINNDIYKFFKKPVVPDINTNNDVINEFLSQNSENIFL